VLPTALILDFGEVLVRPQSRTSVETLAALAGLPVEDFSSRYWRHREAYDLGLSGAEYWQRVLEDPTHPSSHTDQLIRADAASWTDYRIEMWDLTKAFRARGGRTAMLSNGVHEIIAQVRTDKALSEWFDVVVVSCEVGCVKPGKEIYRACLASLDVPAESALFVDDRVVNLRAAEEERLQTFHFSGDDSVSALRRALAL